MIERIYLDDEQNLVIDIEISDPIAFTEAWSGSRRYRKVDWAIEEFSCMDNFTFRVWEEELAGYDE